VNIPKTGDLFRLLYSTKGRFHLHRLLNPEEAKFKLCRVNKVQISKNKVPFLVTHDGRTIRYPDPLVKVNDTVKVDLESGKFTDFLKFEPGNLCMISRGRNTGRVGIIQHIERHPGSFDIVEVKDAAGHVFATRRQNVFVIGKGAQPWVSLPKGKGLKKTILEEKADREKKAALR
jgi:small subunit ribosomal protein S4e